MALFTGNNQERQSCTESAVGAQISCKQALEMMEALSEGVDMLQN